MSDTLNNTLPIPTAAPPAPSAANLPMSARPDVAPSLQDATAGTPAAAPNLPAAQPNMPTQPKQTPQGLHESIFKHVLNTLAGGGNRPVRDANGNPVTDANGQVQMAPASKKTLGMSILAGALAGMAAGFNTSNNPNIAKSSPEDINAFNKAAGNSAGSAKIAQGTAQEEADTNKLRAYTTMDHNLKLHVAQINATKLQGDVLQSSADDGSVISASLALAPPITTPDGKVHDAIMKEGVTGTELQQLMSTTNPDGTPKDPAMRVTQDSAIPTGVTNVYDEKGKQRFNSDGTPVQENTYTVYDHSAMVAMTDQLKSQFPGKFDNVAVGTALPVRVLAKYARENTEQKGAATAIVNQVDDYNTANKTNLKFDLSAAVAKDPIIKTLYGELAKYGTDPLDLLFKDLRTNKDIPASAVGALQNAMGVTPAGLEKMRVARTSAELAAKDAELEAKTAANEAAKEKSPAGQLDMEKKQLEVQTLKQQIAQADAAKTGITPPGFEAPPDTNEMEMEPLQKTLAAKGVKIPADFATLYKIAHGQADLATEYTNNPRKGMNLMTRSEATRWVSLINPNWQEGDYKANANLTKSIRDTKVGTAGGTLLAAGVAANHLDLLAQAGDALKNNNIQVLNSIAQKYGVETGAKPAVVFKAIGQKLNEEVEKVTAGGTPQVAALKEAHDNLNVAESPEQIKGVVNAYVGLMNGRTSEIDAQAYRYTGRHIGVSPNVAKIYNAAGYKVPGQPDTTYKPAIRNNEIVGWITPDGKGMINVPKYR